MLKAMFVAACLAIGAAAVAPSLAQEPLVLVPDFPGGGGVGGGGGGGANAVATASLNVRTGPGTRYPVVHVLQSGERVRISRCSGGWCFTESRGRNGWASENFLRRIGGGGGGGPVRPTSEVCFFEDARFRGRSFCAAPGDSDRNLGAWNNRISSISIRGSAAVEVCTDRNFRDCETFSRDVPFLPWWLDRNISAYQVFR